MTDMPMLLTMMERAIDTAVNLSIVLGIFQVVLMHAYRMIA